MRQGLRPRFGHDTFLAMEEMMKATKIVEHARQLLDARGDRAEAEAAQRAIDLEAKGKAADAENWRRVRAAIREMRPPHVS